MAAAAGALARDDGDWDEPFTDGNNIMPTVYIPRMPNTLSTPRSNTESISGTPTTRHSDSRLQDELEKDKMKSLILDSFLTDNTGSYIIEHVAFKGIVSGLVIFNAITMGVEQDYREHREVWSFIDHFLAAAFFIEMIIKMAVLRINYFHDRWNWLDCALALMALLDTWCVTLAGGSSSGLEKLTLLRVLRLMRLARLARLFRSFNRLVIVLKSIVDAIESTLWVTMVLICCIYMAAIVCVMFIGHEGKHLYPGYSTVMEVIDEQEVMQNFNPHLAFGSMASAMVTLFNVAVFAEWTEVVRPIWVKQPMMIVFFMVFSVFVCFGVMNVIIGMIVDSVIQNARSLEKELEKNKKNEKFKILKELKEAIFLLDEDGDMNINMDELDRFMNGQDPELWHLLSKLNLPHGCSSQEFFTMLDNDGSGELDHDEFLTSLYRLINCGPFQQTCLLQMGLNEIKTLVKRNANTTNSRIDEIAAYLGMPPPKVSPPPPETDIEKPVDNEDYCSPTDSTPVGMPKSIKRSSTNNDLKKGAAASANDAFHLAGQQKDSDSSNVAARKQEASASAVDTRSNSKVMPTSDAMNVAANGHCLVQVVPDETSDQRKSSLGTALSTVCEEIGVLLQDKVRAELGARLKDLLPFSKAEELCKLCGKGGVWQPVEENVVDIKKRTINRDKDIVGSATPGQAASDTRQWSKGDPNLKHVEANKSADVGSHGAMPKTTAWNSEPDAKLVSPENHLHKSREDSSHPMGVPSVCVGALI